MNLGTNTDNHYLFLSESEVLEQTDEYDLWIEMDKKFENLSNPILEKIEYTDYEKGSDWVKL